MAGDSRAQILIIDDTPAKVVAIEAILAPLRQRVVTAGSGREALRMLLREDFALILLDVRMTDMDGFETAALIRQRRASEHTPIIFLTAFDQAEIDMARGYSLGAVDYIFSPIQPEVLRAKAAVFVELYQKTDEISHLYTEAQASSRSKSEFLNMAAHELRTPLSVVSGYLALLAEGSMGAAPPAWKMPIDMLTAKAAELNRIVDDLLLASRMEVNALPGQSFVFDLRESIEAAVARAAPRTLLLEAELSAQLGDDQLLVEADPEHIARILDNLVNNALTYCVGTPRITISCADPAAPTVTVRDNGVGIPPDKREAVFERFVRLEDDVLGPVPGTGLGLYISRELARRHGGDLELDEAGAEPGAAFTLRLPAAQGNGLVRPKEATRSSERPHLHVHHEVGHSGSGGSESRSRAAGAGS